VHSHLKRGYTDVNLFRANAVRKQAEYLEDFAMKRKLILFFVCLAIFFWVAVLLFVLLGHVIFS